MATITVTKGYNDPTGFTSGETVTPAKLNSAQSPTAAITFDTAADTDDSTLEVSGGKFRLKDGGVATAKLADSGVTPAKLAQPLTLGTAQATTSGTSIDFTGIPSWVKRITVMLQGVSTNGNSVVLVQLGTSSGITTSGYLGYGTFTGAAAVGAVGSTAGIPIGGNSATAHVRHGSVVFNNVTGNVWVGSYAMGLGAGAAFSVHGGGSVTLGGALDRIRLVASNGTDTFDAGLVNIMYEG